MNEQTFSIGPIMKAARKFKKFNQADVAKAIGCSQSALSKMEHNLLVPSAPQWFLFARFTSIPPEALETGIIDRRSLVKINSEEVSLGFKIPKKYRLSRGEKVRQIYPFLKAHEALGKEFIASSGLDPEFFLDFDNLANYQLFLDAVDFFIQHGKNSPEEIRQIVKKGQDDIYWDHYGIEWRKYQTPKEVVLAFINNQAFFQADFILKPEYKGEDLIVNYVPEKHAQIFGRELTDQALDFIRTYRKYTLENLIERELGEKVSVQDLDGRLTPLGDRFEILAQAS